MSTQMITPQTPYLQIEDPGFAFTFNHEDKKDSSKLDMMTRRLGIHGPAIYCLYSVRALTSLVCTYLGKIPL